ncbi:MAG TPA: amidohydrolase family protein [Thermomicrobiaceae bacterium]|nr:amidohydrolase family protein [Thermomicrobiaceae bacterium]
MTIEVADLPVVDVHCHPFLNRGPLSAEQFTDLASFGGGSRAFMEAGGVEFTDAVREELQRIKRDTTYFRRLVRDLARFFGVEPTLDTVLARRNDAVEEDYTAYVRRLYADAGLTTLVFDFGYPQPPVDEAATRAELPVEIVPVFRIEPLIVELLASDAGWDEFRRRFDAAIAEALQHRGYRGLKSIIAYRTGLDVSPVSRTPDQGYRALDAIRHGLGGGSMKQLRDHLLCRSLELCMEYDVPMQIHTGMGDFEVNLPAARPALLLDLLRFPAYRACKVLLVHTGYPYHREAGYLANVLPRVYCDVSEGVPFAGHGAKRIISEVLEMAPLSKVVYGSDGFSVPEINFASAKLGKQAIAQALDEIVADGGLSTTEAREAAGLILSGNARQLYELD